MKMRKAVISDLAKIIILSSVMLSLLSPFGLASTISSEFSCSVTNGVTTHYTYLKTPGLLESGYTKGLKTGSLSYYNGSKDSNSKAILNDTLYYFDGRSDISNPYDSNASVTHYLGVDFSGDDKKEARGISHFYAQGFYADYRGLSATKDFWFNTRKSYLTNVIYATANAKMDLGGTYDLTYQATAKNAYFVFHDASGLSNKTGMRRIDWEQEGLIKGTDVAVTNNLQGSFKSRAGPEDWLPCNCLSGLIPDVEPIQSALDLWPSPEAKSILQPVDLKLEPCPTNGPCYHKQIDDWQSFGGILYLSPLSGSASVAIPMTPAAVSSPAASAPTSAAAVESPITLNDVRNLPQVQIESYYKSDDPNLSPNTTLTYTIKVRNLAKTDAKEVVLVHKLADGESYIGGSAKINGVGNNEPRIEGSSLIWPLGILAPNTGPIAGSNTLETVTLQANITDPTTPGYSQTYATYVMDGILKNTISVNSSKPTHTVS